MTERLFVLNLLNGVTFGALLFLLASGFTLIFGLMRVVNLAHGSLYLLGGYLGLTAMAATGNFWIGMGVAGIAVAVLGVALESTLLRRVQGRTLSQVLLTIGAAFVMGDIALAIWGGDVQLVEAPAYLQGSVDLLGVTYPRFRLILIGFGAIAATILWLVQARTRLGIVIRAGVDDREMIEALGVNITRLFTAVFIIGAMLAGAAGVIGGSLLGIYPGADFEILLFGLVVVIIGGMGSLRGALIGSLLVGLLDSFGKALIPELSYFLLFGPMLLVLLLRPRGLFGR